MWVVNKRKDNGVGEPGPGEEAHADEHIPEKALVDVEHFSWVKGILLMVEDDNVGDS